MGYYSGSYHDRNQKILQLQRIREQLQQPQQKGQDMKASDVFPSKYLAASDLQGRHVTVTIDYVEVHDVDDGQKPAVYFKGKQKALLANKTNTRSIAELHGDEMDNWTGKRITLYSTPVLFQGRTVPAIRVAAPSGGSPKPEPAPVQEREPGEDADDFPF